VLGAGLVAAGAGLALAASQGLAAVAAAGLAAAGTAAVALRTGRHGAAARNPSTPPPEPAGAPAPGPARPVPAPAANGRVTPMITEVVPVWARQLESTRSTADAGLNNALNAFVEMNGALDALLGGLDGMSTGTRPGAVDAAVTAADAPLQGLRAASERAFAQRDRALAELARCDDGLAELQLQARQTVELGRHTRLVAFNASIEASRGSDQSDAGNEAVAHEMRLLATRLNDTATAMVRLIGQLRQRLGPLKGDALMPADSEQELRMEIDLHARESLKALLAGIGGSLSTSGSVRESSEALRHHLEQAFVHFQFGDRVSQMLAIIGNDMHNFVEWTSKHPNATVDDANEWLKRLEASYTMEEQRSEHHGNVHVDRGSEVEFF
jgi:methyl-accepting chemotaxis protein